MILNPTDENYIYSILLFVIDQVKILNVQTPSITFDQPLWLKTTIIIKEANPDAVCSLWTCPYDDELRWKFRQDGEMFSSE